MRTRELPTSLSDAEEPLRLNAAQGLKMKICLFCLPVDITTTSTTALAQETKPVSAANGRQA